ncbi:lymphocyte antigen 96 isoform X1 [Aquarana catesbeiana]|uniref:lymphocyte antigen 96 isoform X1 n=1 Tax=Aquarana catesbeiana TaxID=8400 RepID=UPI003CCA50C8
MIEDMIKVLFFFQLLFVPMRTITKHIMCDNHAMELFYVLCDENHHFSFSVDPCTSTWKEEVNFSMTFIPRMNLDNAYVIVEIWKNSLKISEGRYDLCTGIDDEFDFCGALKGETITGHKKRTLSALPFLKGTSFGKFRVFAGQKEELILCVDVTLIYKL